MQISIDAFIGNMHFLCCSSCYLTWLADWLTWSPPRCVEALNHVLKYSESICNKPPFFLSACVTLCSSQTSDMMCYWTLRLGAAGLQTKGAWNSFHEHCAAGTGKAGRLVMSHVPIATPPVWEGIAPSLAAHALRVDVNIVYMGLVIAVRGDYQASVICFLI